MQSKYLLETIGDEIEYNEKLLVSVKEAKKSLWDMGEEDFSWVPFREVVGNISDLGLIAGKISRFGDLNDESLNHNLSVLQLYRIEGLLDKSGVNVLRHSWKL